jgi:hypothetical protein
MLFNFLIYIVKLYDSNIKDMNEKKYHLSGVKKPILVSITLYCNSTYYELFDDNTTNVKEKNLLKRAAYYSKRAFQSIVGRSALSYLMNYVFFPSNFKHVYYNDKSHFGLITEKKFIMPKPDNHLNQSFFFEEEYNDATFINIINLIKKNAQLLNEALINHQSENEDILSKLPNEFQVINNQISKEIDDIDLNDDFQKMKNPKNSSIKITKTQEHLKKI